LERAYKISQYNPKFQTFVILFSTSPNHEILIPFHSFHTQFLLLQKQAVTRSNQKTRDTTSGEMGFDSQRDYRKESYPHTGRFEKQQKISDLEHERNERGTDVYGRGREPSNPNKHVLQK